jgi:23S rRNA (adenine2503-C2)-methyltransferase
MRRLFDLPLAALEAHVQAAHQLPAYTARTIWREALQNRAAGFASMTSIPKAARAALAGSLQLRYAGVPECLTSKDGTKKYLVSLPREDAALPPLVVESVLIPHPTHSRRSTLCVSSQAGCALACSFCSTGSRGFTANLSAADIVEQVLAASPRPTNVVFMGQGEPLLNLKAVALAAAALTSPYGLALPPRRVTISTSGIAPAIPKLAALFPGVRLALSLHAPDDALRSRLMGINDQYPLQAVMAALSQYVDLRLASLEGGEAGDGEREEEEEEEEEGVGQQGAQASPPPKGQHFNGTRRVRVSFEYLLLAGVNDSPAQAAALARLLTGWRPNALLHSHVNLIPYNAWGGAPSAFQAPQPAAVREFARVLLGAGLSTTVRAARGVDVSGACGQLETAVKRQRLLKAATYARW